MGLLAGALVVGRSDAGETICSPAILEQGATNRRLLDLDWPRHERGLWGDNGLGEGIPSQRLCSSMGISGTCRGDSERTSDRSPLSQSKVRLPSTSGAGDLSTKHATWQRSGSSQCPQITLPERASIERGQPLSFTIWWSALSYLQKHDVPSTLAQTALGIGDSVDALDWQNRIFGEAWEELAVPPPRDAPSNEGMANGGIRAGVPGEASGDASWQRFLDGYPWPADQAYRVIIGPTPPNAWAPNGCPNGESGGNPLAYNAGNYGLLQINYDSHVNKLLRVTGSSDPALLYDPAVNIAVGYLVWLESGGGSFLPWSCRP